VYICIVKDKNNECDEANDDGADNVSGFPRIHPAAPIQTHDKQDQPSRKEDEAHCILAFDLLGFGSVDMQMVEGRWVVEQEQSDDREASDDDVDIITPTPGCGRSGDKGLCDDWAKAGKLEGRKEDASNPQGPVLVWNQFGYGCGKGDLHGTRNTIEAVGTDQAVDVLCGCADDSTDKAQEISTDHKPTPSKDVAESTWTNLEVIEALEEVRV